MSDQCYHYIDAVLRYWVAYVQQSVEAPEFPGQKDLAAIIDEQDRSMWPRQASRPRRGTTPPGQE